MTLTEFLLARIAEDEAVRHRILGRAGFATVVIDGVASYADPNAERLLAECEAKRRIVALLDVGGNWHDYNEDAWATLCLLALPYADHPDYDGEWKL